jgi:hypothetical protein
MGGLCNLGGPLQPRGASAAQAPAEPATRVCLQSHIAALVQSRPPARTACMALMMLCMDVGWEARVMDAVESILGLYPGLDWLVVTLPCDEQPPEALAHFECLAPLPWSSFPHKLFLLHRYA